jgi:hypothetical protein
VVEVTGEWAALYNELHNVFFFFFLDMGWILLSPFQLQKIKIGPSIDFLVFLYPLFL